MCATCTTTIDVLGTNFVLLTALAGQGWRRAVDRVTGHDPLERQLSNWERDARFVAQFQLDPLTVLGAPPAIPVEHATADDVALCPSPR